MAHVLHGVPRPGQVHGTLRLRVRHPKEHPAGLQRPGGLERMLPRFDAIEVIRLLN